MSSDEPIRLHLHHRLTELLDSDLADAMMEFMPPMPWDQLATKDDVARLDGALADTEERLDSAIRAQGERLEGRVDAQGHHLAGELALLEGRLSVRYIETTRMIVFAMMTLFVGVVAVMATTLS